MVKYRCIECNAEFEAEPGSKRKFCDKCIEAWAEMNYDYRKGQADLIQAFRLRSNQRIKELRAFKVTTTEASLMKQGALITWREARRVLSELAIKKEGKDAR